MFDIGVDTDVHDVELYNDARGGGLSSCEAYASVQDGYGSSVSGDTVVEHDSEHNWRGGYRSTGDVAVWK